MKKEFAAWVFCVLLVHTAWSQSPDSLRSRVSQAGFISHRYDNDFFSATDIYYTQGIRYEVVLRGIAKSPIAHALVRLSQGTLYNGISAEQDCFTPSSIRRDTVFTGDRPFAAVAFAGEFLVSNDNIHKQRLTSELDIGAIGPCAKCEEEQKGIHRMLVNIQPLGWQFQIRQDLILTYSLSYDKALYSKKYLELMMQSNLTAGTLYDKAWAGLQVRSGKMLSWFETLAPGETSEAKKIQFWGFLSGRIQGTAYDATMQGGMFDRNNIYTMPNIQHDVYFAQYGLVFAWKKFSLEYSKAFISPEFKGGMPHGWGHCDIRVAF
jgi:lipid A 3-O-deacylase